MNNRNPVGNKAKTKSGIRASLIIIIAVVCIESCIHLFVNYSYIQQRYNYHDYATSLITNALYNYEYLINGDKDLDESEKLVLPEPMNRLQQKLAREDQHKHKSPPDALFNGVGVNYRPYSNGNDVPVLHSLVHCVGENFQEDSWMHRSCQFRNLCFDMSSREFLLFQSPLSSLLETKLKESRYDKYITTATAMNATGATMALGSINLKWGSGVNSMKWFPRVVSPEDNGKVLRNGYYELPDDRVLVPYHSLNGMNPGHLIWDDFLPLYTLMSMFDLVEDKDLMLMRFIENPPLWATCDTKNWRIDTCNKIVPKFLPLMGIEPKTYKSFSQTSLNVTNSTGHTSITSNIVCSKHAAAGIGSLSDHGTKKKHGWEDADYETTHNHGRGALLYEFRNYMLSNVGIPFSDEFRLKKPYNITFSINSSRSRHMDFKEHMQRVSEYFSSEDVSVKAYVMKDISLTEQIRIASESAIYITINGGGAVTGMFLPKGACILMYYDEVGGLIRNRKTYKPAMLDWDLLNNLSHLRTHWLPSNQGSKNQDLQQHAFISLIEHELQMISQIYS